MTCVTPPCSGKTSLSKGLRLRHAAGSARNSPFWRSHFDTLAPLGLALLIVTTLLYIMAARTLHHSDGWRCHPGDRATTNGRELCPDRGVGR